MNFDLYCGLNGVNFSTLKRVAKSPLDYYYGLTHERPDTAPMSIGRAVHVAVLEPDTLPLRYAVWDGYRRGKDWTQFQEANEGREILTATEYARCLAIRDSVRSHPVAGPLLAKGESEVTVQWTDEETGLSCKARLDHLCGDALTDLKTTTDIGHRAFARTCARYEYHAQMAHYQNGLLATGHDPAPVRIVAVESEPPHDVAVYLVDEDALYAGADKVAKWLRIVAECQESGLWPGQYPEQVTLDLPPWAFDDDGNDDELIIMGLKPSPEVGA